MGTEVIFAALLVAVFLALRHMARAHKKGKSLTCGGNCGSCSKGCRY